MPLDRVDMFSRPVTHMSDKPIFGKAPMKPYHPSVAEHLGGNGCHGDRRNRFVTPNDGTLPIFGRRLEPAVEEDRARSRRKSELTKRARKRCANGGYDAIFVDHFGRDERNSIIELCSPRALHLRVPPLTLNL